MNEINITNLQDSTRFRLLERLEFTHLLPFVLEYYLRRRNRVVLVNYLLNLVNLAAVFWVGLRLGLDFSAWMIQLGQAALVMLLLIPVHELLHALVYKLLGASDVRFGLLLRQGAVYAVAHHFVAGARAFSWVALAPFLVINGASLLLALFAPDLRFFILLLSLAHLSAVDGDWAMLSFLWEHRAAPVYTCDDADNKITYFYQRL